MGKYIIISCAVSFFGKKLNILMAAICDMALEVFFFFVVMFYSNFCATYSNIVIVLIIK